MEKKKPCLAKLWATTLQDLRACLIIMGAQLIIRPLISHTSQPISFVLDKLPLIRVTIFTESSSIINGVKPQSIASLIPWKTASFCKFPIPRQRTYIDWCYHNFSSWVSKNSPNARNTLWRFNSCISIKFIPIIWWSNRSIFLTILIHRSHDR